MEIETLLKAEIRVINVGLREFARDLEARKTPVVHVEWSPSAVKNPKIAELLGKLGS